MQGQHFAKQTQRERACSLVHGTWRCAGVRVASVGACALMVGQLLLPSVALATECADSAATTGEVAAAPAAPAATVDANAATTPTTEAAPATQNEADTQQVSLADTVEGAGDAMPAEQNASSNNAAMPADNAIMPCGVTDVTGGGGVTIDTNVESYYRECELPPEISLTEAVVSHGILDRSQMRWRISYQTHPKLSITRQMPLLARLLKSPISLNRT